MLWHYILIGLVCLLAGFWLGGRHGRRVKRIAMRELNTNSLDMLETKSKFSGMESQHADYQNKEKLLQLTLQQLKSASDKAKISSAQAVKSNEQVVDSDAKVKKLQQDLVNLNKQQNLNQAFLKLTAQKSRKLAVQAHLRAVKATSLARKATTQLKRLENVITARQSLNTLAPNAYGAGDQVILSVVDQPRLGTGEEMLKQVSNGDSARLTKLRSSIESARL